MLLQGLPVHDALAMGHYTYLGRWARYSSCGTARQSCPVCTIWATGSCDVVATRCICIICICSHISCCYFPFYKVALNLPRKWPTYEIQSFAS